MSSGLIIAIDASVIAKKSAMKPKPKAKSKALPPPPTHSISAYRPTVSKEQEVDFMASILGNMDQIAPTPTTRPRKRKPEPEPDYAGPSRPRTVTYGYRSVAEADDSSDGPLDTGMPSGPSSDDEFASMVSPKKKLKKDPVGMTPAINRLAKLKTEPDNNEEYFGDDAFQDLDMDEIMAIDDDLLDPKAVKKEETKRPLAPSNRPSHAEEEKSTLDATPAWLSVYDSLTVVGDDTFSLTGSASTSRDHSTAPVLEADGSLRFFWLDYLESDGKIYFIGKTLDKRTNAWLSCCVTVENLQRNLFVLPREHRIEEDEETGEMVDTDVVPSLTDVYADFDRIRKKAGIKSWKAKFVKRQYAFGLPDVPRRETQWLKVVYGFDGELQQQSDEVEQNSSIFDRAANTQYGIQSKFLPCLWHKYHRVRTVGTQTQDHGSLLAPNQEPSYGKEGCTSQYACQDKLL